MSCSDRYPPLQDRPLPPPPNVDVDVEVVQGNYSQQYLAMEKWMKFEETWPWKG